MYVNVHAETCLRGTGLQDCDPTEMNFCICVHPQKYTDKKKKSILLLHPQNTLIKKKVFFSMHRKKKRKKKRRRS